MFERAHHNRILRALHLLNAPLFEEASAYFAGGTAIVLLCNEYRESVDIDFICSDRKGYQLLRHAVTDRTLGHLVTGPVQLRNFSADDDGIRCFLMIDDVPIKFEIIQENRIAVTQESNNPFPVPLLSRVDMYAEKLLANADRGLDQSTMSRDMIDLAMMMMAWGDIPDEAIIKTMAAKGYGSAIQRCFNTSLALMKQREETHLHKSLHRMQMDEKLRPLILETLQTSKLFTSSD